MRNFIILLIFLGGIAVNSQEKWTLEQCVSYALKHNLSMQQSVLDAQLAKIQKKNAVGAFMPGINANVNRNWNVGTNIDVTTNNYVTSTIQNTSLGVSSSVTIFDGLKNLNNLYRANLTILSRQYQLDDMKDNVSLQIANAFLQILFNKESLKTLKSQYELNKIEQKRVQQLVNNGKKPEGDLLQIVATIATQEQKIVEGENKVQLSKIALANLLQLQDVLKFDIVEQAYDIPFSQILQKTPQDIFNKALTTRNDILVAQTNVNLAKYDIAVAKGNFLPTLTGSFNYGTRASQETSFKDLWNQFELYDGFSFGLRLNIPIFNRFQNVTNLQRSKILFEKSKLNLKQKKTELKDKIYQAYLDVKGTFKTYMAAEKTVQARQQSMDYIKEKYEGGLMNSFEFNQSKMNLQTAENDLIRAKYNYIFKLKILEFYFGVPIAL